MVLELFASIFFSNFVRVWYTNVYLSIYTIHVDKEWAKDVKTRNSKRAPCTHGVVLKMSGN